MAENACPVTDFDTLMVSTDGSECNEGAVREAINLARGCGSRLLAISVVEANDEFIALAPERMEREEIKVHDCLEAVKDKAAEAGIYCELISHTGEQAYHFIVNEAAKRGVSMIIMGRRGHTGVKKMVMGSVTARVIGHAPCKVLVVPRAAHFTCRNILVATDGSNDSEAAAIEAINLAKRCEGKLTVVSVYSSEGDKQVAGENVAKIGELAAGEGIEAGTLLEKGSPATAITEVAARIQADLIVAGSHGRTGLKRLLMGSVTEGIIGHTECSVLVARQGV
jgi:nucleotide-binding universal stress UspA family protein